MKIGFIAHHPGSANTLTNLIHQLGMREGNEIYAYGFIPYIESVWGKDCYYDDTTFSTTTDVPKDLDVLFYCAASNKPNENVIPRFCKENNIVSISIIDLFDLSDDNILTRYAYVPDVIITPDEITRQQLFRLGIPAFVLNLGNPHFDNFTCKKKLDKKRTEFPITASYISYPASSDLLCDTAESSKEIIKELLSYIKNYPNIEKLYICTHPRESPEWLDNFLRENADLLKGRIQLNPYENTTKACEDSDVIIGYNSTVLYEQAMSGKPVIFWSNAENLVEDLHAIEAITPPNIQITEDAATKITTFLNALNLNRLKYI